MRSMRIAIVADSFFPNRTSASVQLRDLALEMVRQGHRPTLLVPCQAVTSWSNENVNGVEVLRLRAPRTKDVSYFWRTVNEFVMPFAMMRSLRMSQMADEKWDSVIWYSPTIFLGPLVKALKNRSSCQSYLILRDLFPDWAADMNLMRRGSLAYRLFKIVERYQYSVADVIGIQTEGNRSHFEFNGKSLHPRVEVLHNWLGDAASADCSIQLKDTAIAGRKIFVYAGNMGVAQGMDVLIDLAERLKPRRDIGFLFVGRGRDAARLANAARARQLDNVLFREEIHPDEIPGLYAQCHVGIVALDQRHKTHNIPGKFLTYMHGGLPVLANINSGNDLAAVIRDENVGRVSVDNSLLTLQRMAEELVHSLDTDPGLRDRCRALFVKLFSPVNAVHQIVSAVGPQGAGQALRAPALHRATPLEESRG